jgi:hypothetical protein
MTAEHSRNRDGFALPVALLAMVVIGAIVTGGFYVSTQEHDISVSSEQGARALYVAQYGLDEALATWTNAHVAGNTGPVTTSLWTGGREVGTYQIGVLHLGDRVYALESEGRAMRGQQAAVRRVGSFVRTTSAQAPYNSALTVIGAFNRAGNASISGTDGCGGETVAGVMGVEEGLITGITQGNNNQRITGDPAVDYDPTMDQTKLSSFGDIDLDYLRNSATHRYQGSPAHPQGMAPATMVAPSGETVCNTNIDLNWGDQADTPGACGTYYPIVHLQGNGKLDTGEGQGIIIVDGDLHIDGNFSFSGVLIVTGKFTMAGPGSKVRGTVIVQGGGELDTTNEQEGNAMIEYNSCKVRDAFNYNLRVRPLASRSWFTDAHPLPVVGS